MNTRRSFFSRIGAAIATIALAPELAFRAKLALPEVYEGTIEVVLWCGPYQIEELNTAGLTYRCNQPMPAGLIDPILPYSEFQRMRKEANAIRTNT